MALALSLSVAAFAAVQLIIELRTYREAKQQLDDLEEKNFDLEITIAKGKIEKPPLSREQIVFWISKFKDEPKTVLLAEIESAAADTESGDAVPNNSIFGVHF